MVPERELAQFLNELWQHTQPGFEHKYECNPLYPIQAVVQPETCDIEIHFREAHQTRASKVLTLEQAICDLEGFRNYYHDAKCNAGRPGGLDAMIPPKHQYRVARGGTSITRAPVSTYTPPKPAGNPLFGSW